MIPNFVWLISSTKPPKGTKPNWRFCTNYAAKSRAAARKSAAKLRGMGYATRITKYVQAK